MADTLERERSGARRRRWADSVVLTAATFALGFAIWSPPFVGDDVHYGGWWASLAVGGFLGLVAVPAALKSAGVGKVLVALGALALLAGLAAFSELRPVAVVFQLAPAVAMLATLPWFGPMPTPEEEGLRR